MKDKNQKVHEGKEPLTCSVCGKSFSSAGVIRRHKKLVHDKSKPYKCTFCDDCFGEKRSLIRHIWRQHKGKTIETSSTQVKEKIPGSISHKLQEKMPCKVLTKGKGITETKTPDKGKTNS